MKITTNIDFNNFKLFDANNKYKIWQRDQIEYELVDKVNKINNIKQLSTESDKLVIAGVLEINSKIIYGFDNKKRPYKLFTPLNKLFPKMLVAFNGQKIEHNKLVSVKFKNWVSEWPIGEMVNTFGELNPNTAIIDIATAYKQCLLNHGGFYKIKRIKLPYEEANMKHIFNEAIDLPQNLQQFHSKTNPSDYIFMCNIDPEGCTDIDDVISYKEIDSSNTDNTNNKTKVIGIHISDVTYLLYLFSQHYPAFAKDIYKNMWSNEVFATVYPSLNKEKPYGIISDFLIDQFLTLKPNVNRYVWSIYFYIDEANNIIDTQIRPEIINNKQTYTYDEAEIILKNNSITQMNWVANFATRYGKEHYPSVYASYDNHDFNSHYMISLFMTLTNHTIGSLLQSDINTIFRSTQSYINSISGSNGSNGSNESNSFIRGIYNLNDQLNNHRAIGISNYTHFTSPIRRFIDQQVHYRMYKQFTKDCNLFDIEFGDSLNVTNDKINIINRSLFAMKIIGNQFRLLSLIKSNNPEDNKYNCKLLDYVYDQLNNKLSLKWLINDEIKIYDYISNPYVIFSRASSEAISEASRTNEINQSLILRNRLSESESIILTKGNNYNLKVSLLLLNNMKNIKVALSYFTVE